MINMMERQVKIQAADPGPCGSAENTFVTGTRSCTVRLPASNDVSGHFDLCFRLISVVYDRYRITYFEKVGVNSALNVVSVCHSYRYAHATFV